MFWFSRNKPEYEPVTGLVLPGGGARNAYQVGVLRAIADILPPENDNPFPVITGTSSGAINATLLASTAGEFRNGLERLTGIWENLDSSMVFFSDNWSALGSAARWALSMLSGGYYSSINPRSVLDNQPMRELLERHIRFARIQQAIDNGDLRALGITSSGYTTGLSNCYYQADKSVNPWQRTHRRGIPAEIRIDHLMASIAIPLIFPSIKVYGEFHGDGSMRETAPLSPALHLGANRLLIIGIQDDAEHSDSDPQYPSMGQISGYVLDTLFMDRLNADIERLNRINLTLAETSQQQIELESKTLRPIEFLVISPSMDISEIVAKHVKRAPRSVRALLRGMGALNRAGQPLISYLLFEGPFCKELIHLGYEDGMRQRAAIKQLLLTENS